MPAGTSSHPEGALPTKDKAYYQQQLKLMKRNAESWEARAKAALALAGWVPETSLRQQEAMDAFDMGLDYLATFITDTKAENEGLRSELNQLQQGWAGEDKEWRSQVERLRAELDDEKQARARDKSTAQQEVAALKTRVSNEQQAHEATKNKVETHKRILQSKLKDAQKDFDDKLKVTKAQWEKERRALEAKLGEARHEALETKISLQGLMEESHNLKSALDMTAASEVEADCMLSELKLANGQFQQAHQADQAQVDHYRRLLDEANHGRNQALQRINALKAELAAHKEKSAESMAQAKAAYHDIAMANNQLERELSDLKQEREVLRDDLGQMTLEIDELHRQVHHGGQEARHSNNNTRERQVATFATGPTWERILKNGKEFVVDTYLYFGTSPFKLGWVVIIWWVVRMIGYM